MFVNEETADERSRGAVTVNVIICCCKRGARVSNNVLFTESGLMHRGFNAKNFKAVLTFKIWTYNF